MLSNFDGLLGVVNLRFSKVYFVLLLFIYLGAIACIFASSILFAIKLLLSLSVLIHLRYQYFWPVKYSAFGRQDRHWFVIDQNGEKHFATLGGNSIRSARFVLLNLRLINGQGRINLPVFFDSVSAVDFRRLKVALL